MASAAVVVSGDKDEGAMDPALQCANATVKLLCMLNDSSASESLEKLPKELSAKLPNIRNTGILLHQMPAMVIALDSHLDHAMQSASKLEQVKEDIEAATQKREAFTLTAALPRGT